MCPAAITLFVAPTVGAGEHAYRIARDFSIDEGIGSLLPVIALLNAASGNAPAGLA